MSLGIYKYYLSAISVRSMRFIIMISLIRKCLLSADTPVPLCDIVQFWIFQLIDLVFS